MGSDHELRVHRDWIGLLQPVGLVVSPPALLAAQAFPDKNILKEQQALLALITPPAPKDEKKSVERPPLALSFEALATQVLGWKPSKLAGSPSGPALPESLELVLPEFGETLRPTFAVPAAKEDDAEWMILVQELADGASFDEPPAEETKKWHASPQIRLERLLRETGVPIGILANGRFIRLVYAPRGESSGHVTWPVHRLVTALDRDMLSALCMLLGFPRLFALPRDQRLPHLLKESRKYQSVVSTKLAGQVLEALNELLRGFQSANEAAKGGLLDATVREDPDHVYGGLLAVLLRLVFILYAEERGLLSSSAAYVRNYSLVGLFDKLRIDAGRFPDTMDQRYGAWSRLLVLFRMVHDGARRGDLRLPPRYGHLFDPDGWAFLEGRPFRINRVMGASVEVPKVPDGVVLRVLEKLMLLDSDRLSYRALDVEQIGSVYENMMGFRLERAVETSIGVGKDHVVVGLETLLAKKGAEREKLLKETASVELTGKASEALKEAATVDDLVAALSRRISPLTPRTVPAGGLYLQPTDERRRSGSHYTPRELTEPIVRTTLRPILEDLGPSPKPEQLLALKVCDPAMGSGAFLVETCRQLAEQLVKAYDVHGRPTDIPPDEDVLLYAQRQVAQHCLYGVDKNPFAVDLGKLSLWLATLARDHAFTFLDHSIRHGDSLVGLTREQIASFHWAPEKQIPVIRTFLDKAIAEAMALRAKIPDLANSDDVREKRHLLRDADHALAKVRMVGDAVVDIFLAHDGKRDREAARRTLEARVSTASNDARTATAETAGALTFHWAIEFPEVFARANSGFDAVVGNPPFLNAIEARTGRSTRLSALYTLLYPTFAQGAYDACLLFWARATTSLLRRGGRYGMLSPLVLLSSDRPWQGWMHQHWRPDALRVYPIDQFDGAAIRVAAIIGGEGCSTTCAVTVKGDGGDIREHSFGWASEDSNWYSAVAGPATRAVAASEPTTPPLPSVPLSERFDVKAGCATGVAYELSPLVSDTSTSDAPEALRLITTGAIDRYRHHWGQSKIRYLKRDYSHPRWPANAANVPGGVVRARDLQRRPKLLVGGLTAVMEGWLDVDGAAAGVVSTWILTPGVTVGIDASLQLTALKALTVLVNSCSFTREFMRLYGAGAMSGNQTTIKKSALESMRMPDVFQAGGGFGYPEFLRALLPAGTDAPTAVPTTFEKQLAVIHDLLASSPSDGDTDAVGHLVVGRLYGRSLQEAIADYEWWCERARVEGSPKARAAAAEVFELPIVIRNGNA